MFGQPRFEVFCCQHWLDGRSHAEIRISSFCDRRSAPVRSKAGQNPKAPRDGSQWEQPISSQRPKGREQPPGGPGAVTLRTLPSASACRGCCDQGATQRGSFRDRNALSGSCGGRKSKVKGVPGRRWVSRCLSGLPVATRHSPRVCVSDSPFSRGPRWHRTGARPARPPLTSGHVCNSPVGWEGHSLQHCGGHNTAPNAVSASRPGPSRPLSCLRGNFSDSFYPR